VEAFATSSFATISGPPSRSDGNGYIRVEPLASDAAALGCNALYAGIGADYTIRMKNLSLGLVLLLSEGFVVIGCGSSDGAVSACEGGQVDCDGVCIDPIAPTLAAIQSEIFEGRGCAASTCHDADQPEASLDLSSAAESGMNLIGVNSVQLTQVLRVDPGDSNASYLMNKILGEGMALGTLRMPFNIGGDVVLCEPEISAIRQWIDDGAPVN